jgi:hypothetical protein
MSFQRRTRRWEAALSAAGHDIRLRPGDAFQPLQWNLVTKPRYKWFWNWKETILHESIAGPLQQGGIRGVSFHRVELRGVGDIEAEDPIPDSILNQCNEFEDLIDRGLVPTADDRGLFGQFFTMHVAMDSFSVWQHEVHGDISVCQLCGREDWPRSLDIARNKKRSYFRRRRELPEYYAFAVDIFRSHIYDEGYVVSSKFLDHINEAKLQNCVMKPVKVVSQ